MIKVGSRKAHINARRNSQCLGKNIISIFPSPILLSGPVSWVYSLWLGFFIELCGILVEDQDCIEKQDTFYLSINHQTQKTETNEWDECTEDKNGETPNPLKEEEARIRAQSGLVSLCCQGD